jgi:hypothetical protein
MPTEAHTIRSKLPHSTSAAANMNDNLTRRERVLYKALHGLGIAIAVAGLLWFVVLDRYEPTYFTAIAFSLACVLVPIFGYALRSDTRVIHGLRWLRQE